MTVIHGTAGDDTITAALVSAGVIGGSPNGSTDTVLGSAGTT